MYRFPHKNCPASPSGDLLASTCRLPRRNFPFLVEAHLSLRESKWGWPGDHLAPGPDFRDLPRRAPVPRHSLGPSLLGLLPFCYHLSNASEKGREQQLLCFHKRTDTQTKSWHFPPPPPVLFSLSISCLPSPSLSSLNHFDHTFASVINHLYLQTLSIYNEYGSIVIQIEK